MRGFELGRLCARVLQRHSFASLACQSIQLSSLNSSPLAFSCSLRHLGCKLVCTSSEQNEMPLHVASFNPESSDDPQKPLETVTSSPAEQQRPANLSYLKLGKVLDSFLDMGFSHAEIKALFSVQPKLLSHARLALVSELLLLGLSTDAILKALQKSPELLRMSPNHLKDRADLLRKLSFKEGSLNHMAIHCPSIFTLPQSRIEAVKNLLTEKCLFSTQQLSKILRTCPNVLLEDLDHLEYKFQFVYFRMGIKHREIVNSAFFQKSLAEIKNRHIFLERLGLYQTPDKKGQTQIVNPKLKSLIRASETDFVTKIACSSVEEYEIFKKLLAREEEPEWNKDGTLKVELSDVESDEESDTE
ncbi:transcription termination factor 4, mitochondrial isoform X2 [Sphaerodactylus townsendi]|uniref:transcription termination factor 4, mitochondrial isoform X2 n=2 Tax=Sphaerodactylus townsendi TaxID=933632 RepID=UPI0020260FAD|nr:transcription termination factor 4, mitochondrial isoform X2 [Sphaerodactylus townsendi]